LGQAPFRLGVPGGERSRRREAGDAAFCKGYAGAGEAGRLAGGIDPGDARLSGVVVDSAIASAALLVEDLRAAGYSCQLARNAESVRDRQDVGRDPLLR
jgi:hypothetical protein